jgi:hypothetical protein
MYRPKSSSDSRIQERPNEFLEACGNLSVRWGPSNPGRGAASRWSAPEPSKRTRREEQRVLLIVRDEFPGWLFLGGVLSSRARLRFTNRLQYALEVHCWQCFAQRMVTCP